MTAPDPRGTNDSANPGENTRTGYVTLVGRPNAGKSTLMNALIGERLSIVTPKAQTTWQRVTGILTSDSHQMIFLDTPGLLEPNDLLQRSMLAVAREALLEADVILLVLDGGRGFRSSEMAVMAEILKEGPFVPVVAAINKMDLTAEEEGEELSRWASHELGAEPFFVCARNSQGVDDLRARLGEVLPPGPFLYPPDEVARDPVRFFVAEMIRETVFQEYHQEIPYSVFSQIEDFRENEDPIYIQANLFVERDSQKRILIGKKGSSIRRLGTLSREKIEEFLGRRVYLDLWIKVLPNWRRKRGHLKKLGFTIPEGASET